MFFIFRERFLLGGALAEEELSLCEVGWRSEICRLYLALRRGLFRVREGLFY